MKEHLTPAKLKARVELLLDLWERRGKEVGRLVVEGDRVELFTPEAAQNEQDAFEKWEKSA